MYKVKNNLTYLHKLVCGVILDQFNIFTSVLKKEDPNVKTFILKKFRLKMTLNAFDHTDNNFHFIIGSIHFIVGVLGKFMVPIKFSPLSKWKFRLILELGDLYSKFRRLVLIK